MNSQQEAQSLAFPVMMPLVVAFVSFPAILRSPDSTMSVVLSLIPFFFWGTPLIYVIETVPDRFQEPAMANPLAAIIEQARHALIDPEGP